MYFLSWRQLLSKKLQTILILLGISFGTLLFVSISGVQLGLREYIIEQLLNNTAHVLISGEEKKIKKREIENYFFPSENVSWITPPDGLRDEAILTRQSFWSNLLQRDERVVDFSPRIQLQVISSRGKFSAAFVLVGVVPEKQLRISSLEKYMKQGSVEDLKGSNNHIIVGSEIANNLGVDLGQYIQINSGKGDSRPFKLVGIVHFGNKEVDRSLAFAELNDVQNLARNPGKITEMAVKLKDISLATSIAREWRFYGKEKIQDWQESNQMFMEMIRMQDFTRYFITIAVLVVASFGIYNVLSIMIAQKKKEIAILRALGCTPVGILKTFLYQGITLGVTGGALGLYLGYLLCRWIGSVDFNFEIGGSNHLIISYNPENYYIAFLSALFSSLLASIVPSLMASKLTPIDILRSQA